jgi:AcrR family transcriptional regulator
MRERLLASLESLLADGGSYTGLSVQELVDATGVSRATFYLYYEHKNDLLRAARRDHPRSLLRERRPVVVAEPDLVHVRERVHRRRRLHEQLRQPGHARRAILLNPRGARQR